MLVDVLNINAGAFEHHPAAGVLRNCPPDIQRRWVEREMQKQGFCMRRDAQGRFYSALSQSTYTDRLNRLGVDHVRFSISE